MPTGIEWTDETWNPVTGCTKVSPGCDHCYAEAVTDRFKRHDFTQVQIHEDRLRKPYTIKEPSRIFTCSMGDLFHEAVPWEFICRVFEVMRDTPQHTYQVLTKRPGRMAYFAGAVWPLWRTFGQVPEFRSSRMLEGSWHARAHWPANVMPGTSVETQRYRPRIDVLLRVPAPAHFVSVEPCLELVTLRKYLGRRELLHCPHCHNQHIDGRWWAYMPHDRHICRYCGGDWWADHPSIGARQESKGLDWVIVGGESGGGRIGKVLDAKEHARPFNLSWASELVYECRAAKVPVFVKQLGRFPCQPFGPLTAFDDWFQELKEVHDAVEYWEPVGDGLWAKFAEYEQRMPVPGALERAVLADRRGGVIEEWPEALQVRQLPELPKAPELPPAVQEALEHV
ncbi:MAG: DUF5131 family protein [Dehalococcoidia bacterium]